MSQKLNMWEMAKLDFHKVLVPAANSPAARKIEDDEREAFINENCRSSKWTVIHTATPEERMAGKCFANYYFTNLTDATFFKLAFS